MTRQPVVGPWQQEMRVIRTDLHVMCAADDADGVRQLQAMIEPHLRREPLTSNRGDAGEFERSVCVDAVKRGAPYLIDVVTQPR